MRHWVVVEFVQLALLLIPLPPPPPTLRNGLKFWTCLSTSAAFHHPRCTRNKKNRKRNVFPSPMCYPSVCIQSAKQIILNAWVRTLPFTFRWCLLHNKRVKFSNAYEQKDLENIVQHSQPYHVLFGNLSVRRYHVIFQIKSTQNSHAKYQHFNAAPEAPRHS